MTEKNPTPRGTRGKEEDWDATPGPVHKVEGYRDEGEYRILKTTAGLVRMPISMRDDLRALQAEGKASTRMINDQVDSDDDQVNAPE